MPHNSERRSKRESSVLKDLAMYEYAVHEWVTRSRVNAIWFISDPASALREANRGIDEALLGRLESVPKRELARLLRSSSVRGEARLAPNRAHEAQKDVAPSARSTGGFGAKRQGTRHARSR